MNILDSKLYGRLPEPENFEELLNLLVTGNLAVRMWRGQCDIDWRIDHAAFRRLALEGKKVTEIGLTSYENQLLLQATHKGFRYQDSRTLSDLELLAKLQHHGAATRLLDFTRNSLIALWFCVNYMTDKHGLLIGVHSDQLGGTESELESDKYSDVMKSIESFDHPQTWEPPVLTPRIAAQHSQFLYSRMSDGKMGSLELSGDDDDDLLLIAIHPTLKLKFLEILEVVFDIRHQSLFPDVNGFGSANKYNITTRKMDRW